MSNVWICRQNENTKKQHSIGLQDDLAKLQHSKYRQDDTT
jgi:hypothetical protein